MYMMKKAYCIIIIIKCIKKKEPLIHTDHVEEGNTI